MKVYKRTIYISLLITTLLAICSVCLNSYDNRWANFTVNWCVGVDCSLIVVILTTFIQFKAEQKQAIKELGSCVSRLLFHNQIYGVIFEESTDESMSPEQIAKYENEWYEALNADAKQINDIMGKLEFFNNKKIVILFKRIISLRIDLVKVGCNVQEVYHRSQKSIYEVATNTLQFDIGDYDKKEIKKHVDEYIRNEVIKHKRTV